MNILLLGSGGREHALAHKISQSPLSHQLYIITGNSGTALHGKNIEINTQDFEKIAHFIIENKIEMVVAGSEEFLVKGFRDFLENHAEIQNYFQKNNKNLIFIGANKQGAILEGSKDFSKKFMQKYQIPTAQYATFESSQFENAKQYLQNHSLPIVLKADGLAQGKGVIICENHQKAIETLEEMLIQKKFGEASDKVVVEQFLTGIEVSVFVLCDGKNYLVFPEAKDYKRIGEGDTGLNTGGMGAVSPVHFVDNILLEKIKNQIIEPTLKGLQAENIDYQGFIFLGLMISPEQNPFVIEYNVRLGDPETEAIMPRIENDLVEIFKAVGNRNLDKIQLKISPKTAVTTVIVSGGYPENYEKNKKISNLDFIQQQENTKNNVFVYHAGTKISENNDLLTNGGRVIALTALGENLAEAQALSQEIAKKITFENSYFRRDIGKDLERFKV